MAGMNGLGRVFDVVYAASGVAISIENASAVTFVVPSTGASSIAVVGSKTFAGASLNWTTANGFGQPATWYQATAQDGSVHWTSNASVWSTNTLPLAATTGYVSCVSFLTSQFALGYAYIKATATNGSVVAFVHDLTIQRKPANLVLLGA